LGRSDDDGARLALRQAGVQPLPGALGIRCRLPAQGRQAEVELGEIVQFRARMAFLELGQRGQARLPPLEILLQTSVHPSSRISLSAPRARHCIALIAPLLFPRAEATSSFLIPARYFSSTTCLCAAGSRSMAWANVTRSSTVQPI